MSGGPAVRCAVRAGAYYDSIVLMQLQRALAALPGVLDAGVMMATPANRDLLAASGLLPGEEVAAGPDDLLIAVQAESEAAAGEALARVDALLAVRRAGAAGQEFRPKSLASAFKQLPEARWVLVSVPGRHAAAVAGEALDSEKNVFLYSDNVSLADELELKKKARDRGLLVMGPDCGTAIVGGTGLGFSNRTQRGRIGLIGASGTGLQAVVSHLHARGAGISQALGLGGRDLYAEVGGITAAQALDLLARDPETDVIVLISKPPAPEVARRLIALARGVGKPAVVYFPGAPLPAPRLGNVGFASSLEGAAEDALRGLTSPRPPLAAPVAFAAGQRWIRGLFSGGTLALEVLRGLEPLFSKAGGHTILDLGADEFTVGRLHPMIDFDLRLRRLRQEAADPEVALVLLDVVLGDGAHADPAGELGPVIERVKAEAQAAGRALDVAVLVIGTDQDPQDVKLQTVTLEKAGARVCRTVTDLLDYAVERLEEIEGFPRPEDPPVPLESVQGPLAAVNVGLESFYDSLLAQGAQAVHVEWKPPAGGNEKLAGILARMKRSR
ncbi:MAG TPA: acyl-CoA synthetase FdrA [Thermoanaerobaculia bacterium]|nr:acyl-CoA synthetase FdrA [Thermoanaerobaculia bacterium]